MPGQGCSRTCGSPRTVITCRCIDSPRSMPAQGSRSSASLWPIGWAKQVRCCDRSQRRGSTHVLWGDKVHADDTPVPVLAALHGQTKTGRRWTYVRDDRPAGAETPPTVWFAYFGGPQGRASGRAPEALHRHSAGGRLWPDSTGCIRAGGDFRRRGFAHVRRKFYEIHQAHSSPIAGEALKRISALYAIEDEVRGRLPDERAVVRRARAGP
jgi:transposase